MSGERTGVSGPQGVTRLLAAWSQGDRGALEELTRLVYDELRRLAHRHMAGQRADHTLQTTALLNEAYLRLAGQEQPNFANRSHFLAVAARAMRQILTGVRDLEFARPDTYPNLETAFDWAKVSADGLSTLAREFLIILLTAKDNTASIESIKAQLGEPGPLKHEEQVLLKRNLITITGRGRQLTDNGRSRALAELMNLREKAHA